MSTNTTIIGIGLALVSLAGTSYPAHAANHGAFDIYGSEVKKARSPMGLAPSNQPVEMFEQGAASETQDTAIDIIEFKYIRKGREVTGTLRID